MDLQTIVIEKQTLPNDGDPTLFNFTGDVSGQISDNQTLVVDIAPGQYNSTEAIPSGWLIFDIVCDDDDSFGNTDTATATFNVSTEETVTCTFVNIDNTGPSTIVIVKDTIPDDPQDFGFIGDLDSFTLDDDGLIFNPLNNVEVFTSLESGQYNITENTVSGWDLINISCDDTNSSGNTDAATATINLESEEMVTCTFTNQKEKPPTPDDDKIIRGDNQWDTRPTFGINHETRETMLVDNGFTFNGDSFMITDNHHTPFEQQSINIGTENTFTAKVYAGKRLMVQEFLFGIPEIGMGHLAEMRVEVWYTFDGEIEDVKVIQESDVIDAASLSITHQKIKCQEKNLEEKCDSTQMAAIFLEPLKDSTMAIKAIDFKFRDQTTYLNDGFDILSE
jgi:hypothetical protein